MALFRTRFERALETAKEDITVHNDDMKISQAFSCYIRDTFFIKRLRN